MCTAISWQQFFGRTLDLEYSYDETVTITPRRFPLPFRRIRTLEYHYAIIGMAYVVEGYPLYYDGVNEKGLAMAGLHFPDNAAYFAEQKEMDNIAPFELIPWLLGQCRDTAEAEVLLQRLNLTEIHFSSELPLSPLHWMLSDGKRSLTIESTEEGLRIYDNPVGLLTNNPPFPMQLFHLSNYLNLTREVPQNRFTEQLALKPYSRGMGALGLPGDASSASRFVRAAFVKENAAVGENAKENIGQLFHILGAVEQQKGCIRLEDGSFEKTVYIACCNRKSGVYCYTTYENHQITAVELHQEDLEGSGLTSYPLMREEQIYYQNRV